MFNFLSKFLNRGKSSNIAKERLQLVLIHDRNDISPEVLEQIKVDMIKTLKKYLEIDEKSIEMELEHQNRSVALVTNIKLKTTQRPLRGQKKK